MYPYHCQLPKVGHELLHVGVAQVGLPRVGVARVDVLQGVRVEVEVLRLLVCRVVVHRELVRKLVPQDRHAARDHGGRPFLLRFASPFSPG